MQMLERKLNMTFAKENFWDGVAFFGLNSNRLELR